MEQQDSSAFLLEADKFNLVTSIEPQGKFGRIEKVVVKSASAASYCRRVVVCGDPAMDRTFVESVDVLAITRPHPSLPSFIGFTFQPDRSIFVEFLQSSLATVLEAVASRVQPPLTWDDTFKSMTVFGVAAALMHLHAHGFVHGFLCPQNVMFDGQGYPKVTDFCFSTQRLLRNRDPYIAPESGVSTKGDVYAYGIILYHILTGRPQPGLLPADTDHLLAGICEHCVLADPAMRPEFYDIIQALYDATNPPFRGANGETYRQYKDDVFERTLRSLEAEEVFNLPPESGGAGISFETLKSRADSGDTDAQVQVAQWFATGRNCAPDLHQAFAYFSRAADAGSDAGLYFTGTFLRTGYGCTKDVDRAAQYLQTAASRNHKRALEVLSGMFFDGEGVRSDPREGLKLLKNGADLGDPVCQYLYARRCWDANNLREAAIYLELAHLAGDESASCDWATMLIQRGGAANIDEGINSYRRAASQGSTAAMINLGLHYISGKIVARDLGQAARYFKMAAARGNPRGMAYWAVCLKQGKGVTADLKAAREMSCRAAEKGDVMGQAGYARMCQIGEGGPIDFRTAYRYYAMAAGQGDTNAMMKYGEMTVQGDLDIPTNIKQAEKWVQDCVRKGVRGAAELLARFSTDGS
jgi:TPR repeat protein